MGLEAAGDWGSNGGNGASGGHGLGETGSGRERLPGQVL